MSTARAHVQITVEIQLPDLIVDEQTIGAAYRQAANAATQALRRGLIIDNLTGGTTTPTPAHIVSGPEITLVLVDKG